jgi:hypothetical protein
MKLTKWHGPQWIAALRQQAIAVRHTITREFDRDRGTAGRIEIKPDRARIPPRHRRDCDCER